jgi:hypothetical protein
MNPQERESMAIACCLICTLSEVMKTCQTCPFNKGLLIKAEQENTRVLNQEVKP